MFYLRFISHLDLAFAAHATATDMREAFESSAPAQTDHVVSAVGYQADSEAQIDVSSPDWLLCRFSSGDVKVVSL